MNSRVVGTSDTPQNRGASYKRARLRRQMYFAQGASYTFDAVILLLYFLSCATSPLVAIAYLLAGLAWTGLMLALSEMHFNESFGDHYLTVPQCIGSLTIQLAAMYFAP